MLVELVSVHLGILFPAEVLPKYGLKYLRILLWKTQFCLACLPIIISIKASKKH